MDVFGGLDEVHAPAQPTVTSVVVVSATRDGLIRDSHGAGAQVYLTGQFRTAAQEAVARTGVGVMAAGHARSERWGLHVLAGLLRMRFAGRRSLCGRAKRQGETHLGEACPPLSQTETRHAPCGGAITKGGGLRAG